MHRHAPPLVQRVRLLVLRVAALRHERAELVGARAEVHEVVEAVVRVHHAALAECRHAQMHHRAVEQQPVLVLRAHDPLLHVRHQHHVARRHEPAVHREVDDLVQRRLQTLRGDAVAVDQSARAAHRREEVREGLRGAAGGVERAIDGLAEVVAGSEKRKREKRQETDAEQRHLHAETRLRGVVALHARRQAFQANLVAQTRHVGRGVHVALLLRAHVVGGQLRHVLR